MTSCQRVSFSLAIWTRSWTRSMQRRSATSFSCFSTKRVGVQQRKTATIQKAAFTHITPAISADPTTCLGMPPKTARHFKMAWAGTIVSVASSVTSATRQLSASITQKSIRELNVTALDATKWIFVHSSITPAKRILPTSYASSTLNLVKASSYLTQVNYTKIFCKPMQMSSKDSINSSSNRRQVPRARAIIRILGWVPLL